MKNIYKKVLRIARSKMYDDKKFEKIAKFCKYKLDNGVYYRKEHNIYLKNGVLARCNVEIECEKVNNFPDWIIKKEQAQKTKYENVYL